MRTQKYNNKLPRNHVDSDKLTLANDKVFVVVQIVDSMWLLQFLLRQKDRLMKQTKLQITRQNLKYDLYL